MDEICEKLQSRERREKLDAMEHLQQLCAREEDCQKLLSSFDECYLHLLKCYSDRFESVRVKTVETVTKFTEKLPPNDFHLLNILGTIAQRLGKKGEETPEESEELRLVYVMQLHALLNYYTMTGNGRSLQEGLTDIVQIMEKCICDPYPAVQREACASVVTYASFVEAAAFQPYADRLAKSLYRMLNHKHSQSRIAAVAALGHLALHLDASTDALPRLIMEVSPLLMDSMPLVRQECGRLGTLLLLKLRDRYSYFDRIIPLILCCLKDESPEVVDTILPLWQECGRQYYEENEAELSKLELGELRPQNYPPNVTRPTIGCRALVQRSLRLLKLITRESSDWKDNVRIHSLRLLYQFVLHAEAAMTAKFFEIFGDVARACRDAEMEVRIEAFRVSDLMGRLFSYDDWREHGLAGLERADKEGFLKCFYYMFDAAPAVPFKDVLQVSEHLKTSDFSQTLKAPIQVYVIKLLESLEDKYEVLSKNLDSPDVGASAALDENMYVAAIKVMALVPDTVNGKPKEILDSGNEILNKMAQRNDIEVGALHERFLPAALVYVGDLDVALDERAEPILLLRGLISLCKLRPSYLRLLQKQLCDVWKYGEGEAKLLLLTTISVAMLYWDSTIAREDEESEELLREFLSVAIEPHLSWRAGANAEGMRALATATISAVAQGAERVAGRVLPEYAKYLPALLEDQSAATRSYAVKSMLKFGEVRLEDLKPIAYGILQRLDDPSAGIRELAATALSQLKPKIHSEDGDEDDVETKIWSQFIRKALDMLFLHYDGPEARLQVAIRASIVKLGHDYPQICKESMKSVMVVSYSVDSLTEILPDLPFTL